ncbi:DUF2721 domain-containing protein [Planctomicrobium sp. SH668]|uniref:DUF2721 domain-containing protein n=1 Tax=Planctomicrobium sp. SH668 TaxID=3448126 RepID=UPI003F5B6006
MEATTNPFGILSLIVAPAILTNAAAVLIMSTSNRLARAVDRARELSKQLETETDMNSDVAERRLFELSAAEDRGILLMTGLRCFYLAMAGFASSTLLSLLGAVIAPFNVMSVVYLAEIAGIIAGVVAVSSLVHGSTVLLTETRIAINVLSKRAALVRARAENATANKFG